MAHGSAMCKERVGVRTPLVNGPIESYHYALWLGQTHTVEGVTRKTMGSSNHTRHARHTLRIYVPVCFVHPESE